MPYTITLDEMISITAPELAFGTVRLLPPWDDIPEDFKRGNRYTELAAAILNDRPLPADIKIELKKGFAPEALNRAVRAHLVSCEPRHEHKIAGVGYMIAMAAILGDELAAPLIRESKEPKQGAVLATDGLPLIG
jgi:hypothetical protein